MEDKGKGKENKKGKRRKLKKGNGKG